MTGHLHNIRAELDTVLTDPDLDTEQVLEHLFTIRRWVNEQIAHAKREQSPL